MQQHEDELKKLNIKVAIITFEAGFAAKNYLNETHLEWPLLVDDQRSLYQDYDMLNASFWDIWGPKTWWAYGQQLLAGQTLKKSSAEDILQRGGDVLIDPQGIIRLHHVGRGPADRPAVADILQVWRPNH